MPPGTYSRLSPRGSLPSAFSHDHDSGDDNPNGSSSSDSLAHSSPPPPKRRGSASQLIPAAAGGGGGGSEGGSFKGSSGGQARSGRCSVLCLFLAAILLWALLRSPLSSPVDTNTTKLPAKQMASQASQNVTSPFSRALPDAVVKILHEPFKRQPVPVVFLLSLSSSAAVCKPSHFIHRNIALARKNNAVVYFIGPDECADAMTSLDVSFEPYSAYADVTMWFQQAVGEPVPYQVRWFVLKAFMERHALGRIFYTDNDVMLFADVTGYVDMHMSRTYIALPKRWDGMRSLAPSQYPSTAVSGHVGVWTYAGLSDFLDFFLLFLKEAVLYGEPGDLSLATQQAYRDEVVLGWYTHALCWMKRPEELHPQCVADRDSGVTPDRSARIRGQFTPRYRVDSLCMPRPCNSTTWSDEGPCVFDYQFSVQTPTQFFHYSPKTGMKCPTSMHYTYYVDWMKEPQKQPVQFLAVHFHAHRKGYLTRGDDPAKTWGSDVD